MCNPFAARTSFPSFSLILLHTLPPLMYLQHSHTTRHNHTCSGLVMVLVKQIKEVNNHYREAQYSRPRDSILCNCFNQLPAVNWHLELMPKIKIWDNYSSHFTGLSWKSKLNYSNKAMHRPYYFTNRVEVFSIIWGLGIFKVAFGISCFRWHTNTLNHMNNRFFLNAAIFRYFFDAINNSFQIVFKINCLINCF